MSETDITDDQVNVSHLYAIVNMDNKSKKNIMETRISNKFEYSIPDISDSLPELSNSDSNLYATLLSVEEIEDSLSCSRTFFGSADDIAIGDTDRTEVSTGSYLMRHGTGPIKKVPPPPPAKPPPYQKGEPDVPQTKEMIFRRSKSTNSKSRLKLGNHHPLTSETEDSKKSNKKLIIQSFRRHKETPEKSTSGLVVSTSRPDTKTTVPVQLPFKKSPLTAIPQDLIPRKLSPPEAIKLANKHSPPDNTNKTTSPPLPLPLPSQTILKPPPPTNPKPTLVAKPPLKPPMQPSPGNLQLTSLPNMNPAPAPTIPIVPTVPTVPTALPAPTIPTAPIVPTTSKPAKHPDRLPPPPPSHSLTLPRNLSDKQNSPHRSPPTSDYTLLTPVSPESCFVEHPTFSPLPTNEPDSPQDQLAPLINDEGYSVLDIQDCNDIVTEPVRKMYFTRTNSLPQSNSTATNNNDVTVSQTQQEKLPPKKPPRRMTSTNLSPTYSSEYTILSSVDSDVGSFIEKQNIMSSNTNGVAPSTDNVKSLKTMTIASHGTRPVPPKPAAYRARSKSHNVDNKLDLKSVSAEYTKSVEVKPEKQQVEATSEGLLHKMSKKFRNKSREENMIPSISTPILETTSSHKVIGLNTLLVSECVAYLKQPRSLREEGLFRIPGELNQVNMYLKQFDYSMKPNLEDELDPNNVSGVLKSHIRNNGGLLPKKEAGEMYAAVRQKNIEEINSVIKTISVAQQSIMKEVLFLFKEVAEHESENKMSAGAIATSCGLSIFPVVNAGNSNLMLKILIDNVEEIFQQ